LYFDQEHVYKAICDYWVLILNLLFSFNLPKSALYLQIPQIFQNQPADPGKRRKMESKLKLLDGLLKDADYAVGKQLTIADLSLLATVTTLDAYKYSIK